MLLLFGIHIIAYPLCNVNRFLIKAIMDIYNNVKKIADRKGISIRQLEIKAGIGNGTIRRWDNISPSVDNLVKVANALGVYPERLMK